MDDEEAGEHRRSRVTTDMTATAMDAVETPEHRRQLQMPRQARACEHCRPPLRARMEGGGEKVGGRRWHPEAAHRGLRSAPKGAAPEWATNPPRTPNHMVPFWPTTQLTHTTIPQHTPFASPITTLQDRTDPRQHITNINHPQRRLKTQPTKHNAPC